MAKQNRSAPEPDDELDDAPAAREPASRAAAAAPARKPSRLAWFATRLIVMLFLLGGVVFALPWAVAKTGLWKYGLSVAAPKLADRVQIRTLSLGWFSGVEANDVQVTDAQGQSVLIAPKIDLRKSLLDLAFNPNALGTISVYDPQVLCVVRADGSNVEDLLALLPKSESQAATDLELRFDLYRAVILVDDQVDQRRWRFEDLTSTVKWSSGALAVGKEQSAEISGVVQAIDAAGQPQPAGKLKADFQLSPATATAAGKGRATLAIDALTLDALAPALRRLAQGASVAGQITVNGVYEFTTDGQLHDFKFYGLSSPGFSVAAPQYLGTDRIQTAIAPSHGDVRLEGGRVTVDNLDLKSSLATLAGKGSTSLPASPAAAPSDSRVELTGRLDLAAIARQLPGTLKLRNDIRIDSGVLDVALTGGVAGAEHTWSLKTTADQLVASAGSQKIEWRQPLTLTADVRRQGANWRIDKLTGNGSFFQLDGRGAIDEGEITARADLDRLVAELAQIVDWRDAKLAGALDGKLSWRRGEGDAWQATGEGQIERLVLEAPGLAPWREDKLQFGVQTTGVLVGSSLERIDQGMAVVVAGGDRFQATLTAPVLKPSAASVLPLQFELRGDLATWSPRVQVFAPLRDWRLAGGIDCRGAGQFSAEQLQLTQSNLDLKAFQIAGPGVAISEPEIKITAVADWSGKAQSFTAKAVTLASSSVALRADNVALKYAAGATSLTGQVDYRGRLERVLAWFPADEPRTWRLQGGFEGRATAGWEQGKVAAQWGADLKELVYEALETPAPAGTGRLISATAPQWTTKWTEPVVQCTGVGSYDPAADLLQLSDAALKSSALVVQAKGSLAQLTTQATADIQGQLGYDLAGVAERLRPMLGETLQLVGREQRQFTIRGPLLAATSAPAGGLISPELSATAELGWQGAGYFGLTAGPATFPAKLDRGVALVGPIDLPVSEGRLTASPKLYLNQPSPILTLDQGPLLTQMRISPELCHGWMKYIAPLLADATRAEGKFSVDMQGAKVPLLETKKSTIGGALTIHNAQIGPGPLAQQYLQLAQQIRGIVETNPNPAPLLDPNKGLLVLPQQQVQFELVDGRVIHRGMTMSVKDIVIQTRGSVGLDQTMELVAEIPVQESWLKSNTLLTSLKGQVLQVPIQGTLASPRLDFGAITQLGRNLLQSAGQAALQKQLEGGLNRILGPGINGQQPAAGGQPGLPNIPGLGPLFPGLQPQGAAPPAGVAPQPGTAPAPIAPQPAPSPLDPFRPFLPKLP